MKAFVRVSAGFGRTVSWARRRSRFFDHVWRARQRYDEVLAGRLAAAISYYAFFAAFSLTVLVYAILGYLLESRSAPVDAIDSYLSDNLPWVDPAASANGRGTVTAVGSITLILAGRGWIDALRSGQRAVWRLAQHPGNLVIRWLADLGILAGLGMLLGVSLATSTTITKLVDLVVGTPQTFLGEAAQRWSGQLLELAVNLLLASAVLAAVPRLRIPWRRLVPSAAMVAVGIVLLNSVGRVLINRTERNPAYSIVAGAVGLLVYLYLINQVILFAAAFCATGSRGRVVDLVGGSDPDRDESSAESDSSPSGAPSDPPPA